MIHKEGYKSLLITFLFSLILAALVWGLFPNFYLKIGITIFDSLIILAVAQFFRNPARILVSITNQIGCPADGKILVIEKTMETEFLHKEMMQISIFMSPLNIHKNLNPLNGIVRKVVYHPGKFLVAFNPKSSTDNERCSLFYETDNKEMVVMRQIAGAVARRIVCYIQTGQNVKAGEEMGFIKFGSRVDLFLPLSYKIKVVLNQKVRGGQTIIAETN